MRRLLRKFRRSEQKSATALAEAVAEDLWRNPGKRYPQHSFGVGTYGWPVIEWDGLGRKLTVGNFCSIAVKVTIFLGGNHQSGWVTTYPFDAMQSEDDDMKLPQTENSKGNVTIGHDVWIGTESLILSGVEIGSGAIIGARSVVTKAVAPYSIVVGNPGRCVGYRIPEELILDMLEIQWWNWPLDKIKASHSLLLSPDVHGFVEKFKQEKKYANN